jgi:clathrin heavy chain
MLPQLMPGSLQVVEQMTRESTHLDVDKVLGFLMDAKLADSRPLINVCDRFDRVTELTTFLYKNNMRAYIEGYVQKVNPSKTPQVVGGLIDSQAEEKFISDLIMSVRPAPPRAMLPACGCCAPAGTACLHPLRTVRGAGCTQ